MITIENWEEYAILRADGELDAEGRVALEAFLAAHPELAEEAQMFDSLRMVPDETVVYAGKESLLKPEPRIIRFDRRWVYGVAAGVALLIGVLAVLRSGEDDGARNAPRLAGGVETPVSVDTVPQSSPVQTKSEERPVVAESTAVAQSTPSRRESSPTPEVPHRSAVSPVQQSGEETRVVSEPVTPLTSAEDRVLAVTIPHERGAQSMTQTSVESPSANKNSDDSRSILSRLPIERERLVVLDDIRETASDRIKSIRETREKIRNTDVTVALGGRDLFTLHL